LKNISNLHEGHENRRQAILEGISKNLSYSDIAEQLGVKRWVVSSDIRRMQHDKDLDLMEMFQKRRELINVKKHVNAQKQDTRFMRMTGMSIDEKMFQNMVIFYKPKLLKVLSAKDESEKISKLSRKVRRILERNNIITHGWGKYEVTLEARNFLESNQIHDE